MCFVYWCVLFDEFWICVLCINCECDQCGFECVVIEVCDLIDNGNWRQCV